MEFQYNDGGRAIAGFKGKVGDCVVRAVAIAADKRYVDVYNAMAEINASAKTCKSKVAGKRSAHKGVLVRCAGFKRYMTSLGFIFVPTMQIGSGCRVHLTDGELPGGTIIVSVSKHYTVVIDGVIHDTFDPQRTNMKTENGVLSFSQRCVYGYWRKK